MTNNIALLKKENAVNFPLPIKSHKEKSSNKGLYVGATALAGIVAAGIVIVSRNKVKPNLEPEKFINTITDIADDFVEIMPRKMKAEFIETAEEKIFRESKELEWSDLVKEKINIRKKIRDKIQNKDIDFNNPRMKKIVQDSDKKIPLKDTLFTEDESDAIAYYQDDLSFFNRKVHEGIIEQGNSYELQVMDELIEGALPLSEDAIVYRGIITKNLFGEQVAQPFLNDLTVGGVVKCNSYVSTSRVYGDLLASFDPEVLAPNQNAGYIMRIKLPQGTKGIDSRRYTGLDLPGGYNAEYILPRKSQFKITNVDDEFGVIDCDYLLK